MVSEEIDSHSLHVNVAIPGLPAIINGGHSIDCYHGLEYLGREHVTVYTVILSPYLSSGCWHLLP